MEKRYIFKPEWAKMILSIRDAEQRQLVCEALLLFISQGIEPESGSFENIVLQIPIIEMKIGFENYVQLCETRKKCGKKGGAPKGNHNARKNAEKVKYEDKNSKNAEEDIKSEVTDLSRLTMENVSGPGEQDHASDFSDNSGNQTSPVLSIEEEFNMYMEDNYPNVQKLNKPLTYDQYIHAKELYGKEKVDYTLACMENWKQLTSKFKSANQTLLIWLKRDKEKNGERKY